MTDKLSKYLLFIAILALLGPNALYLYACFTNPSSNIEALSNPVALAFMVEAMMLLAVFLYYVYLKTKSYKQVFYYLVLAFAGSLAFSFPLFMYIQHRKEKLS